jgi:hypothetical protein
MRFTRKIIKMFGDEYFIEFNIWNHGVTGKHCFYINIRSHFTNPRKLNIRYSNFGQGFTFNGSSYPQYILLESKEVKRKFMNYMLSGSTDQIELWLVKEYQINH